MHLTPLNNKVGITLFLYLVVVVICYKQFHEDVDESRTCLYLPYHKAYWRQCSKDWLIFFKALEFQMKMGGLYYNYIFFEKLGSGSTGEVYRVQDRANGRNYSAKIVCINKNWNIFESKNVWNEIEMLRQLNPHPLLINLHEIYWQNFSYVALITDYADGGDLWDRIHAEYMNDEENVRLYVYQMLMALRYLHSRSILYGDIKLENFVLTSRNSTSLKMIDFSSVVKLSKDTPLMRQFVYSVDYVAPEVLLDKGVVLASDMWSVGVATYKMLCGKEPFEDPDNNSTRVRELIRSAHVDIESGYWKHANSDAKNFVRHLLRKNPYERMSAAQALGHPWMNVSRFRSNYQKYATIWERTGISIEEEGLWAVSRFINDLMLRAERAEERIALLEAAFHSQNASSRTTPRTREDVDFPPAVNMAEEREFHSIADLTIMSKLADGSAEGAG